MVVEHLVGPIEQIPPMVSAVRVDGRRLHELAREGLEIDREPRPVTVYRFEVEPTSDPMVYRIEVHCSKGTYIRTLADDLGRLCGGGAHLRRLRRVAVGGFTVSDAVAPDEVELLALPDAVRDYARVAVADEVAAMVAHGRVLPLFDGVAATEGPWAVLGPDGTLLAMYEWSGAGTVKPAVVVAPQG
jgi:tRNA pseudouridine55 synthase